MTHLRCTKLSFNIYIERNSANMCLEHWFIPGIRGLRMFSVVIQWKRCGLTEKKGRIIFIIREDNCLTTPEEGDMLGISKSMCRLFQWLFGTTRFRWGRGGRGVHFQYIHLHNDKCAHFSVNSFTCFSLGILFLSFRLCSIALIFRGCKMTKITTQKVEHFLHHPSTKFDRIN